MSADDAVVIRTFPNKVVAELAASQLEAENIASTIISDDAGGAYPFLQLTRGVKLLVAPEQEVRAREVLDAFENASDDTEV